MLGARHGEDTKFAVVRDLYIECLATISSRKLKSTNSPVTSSRSTW